MKTSKVSIWMAALMLGMSVTSCNSIKNLSKEEKGAAIGVGTGAVLGGVIGSKSKNPAVYAIVGSAIGGVAGAVIGKYMDKQAAELKEELKGVAEVERIEEGIKVTMGSGLLFGFDSYQLSATTRDNLRDLAETLKKYESTDILVAGHTDSQGAESYNQTLSERRAQAVADFLTQNGVSRNRLVVVGYGETTPTSSNATTEGREKNRRVELAIVANEALKNQAKREAGTTGS